MIPRRFLLATLPGLVTGLSACAPRDERQRAGHGADDGGIGGTGVRTALHGPDDGGIGGTGIFGTLTAIVPRSGTLMVNGLSIGVDADTVIDGELRNAGPLQPGETAAIVARRNGAALTARRVTVFRPLVGPLLRDGNGAVSVLGTPVILRDAVMPAAALETGQRVAISGLWQGERVIATHVALLPAGPRDAVVTGLLRDPGGQRRIGETRLVGARGLPEPGSYLVARGVAADDGRLTDISITIRPLAAFDAPIAALAAEAFPARDPDGQGLHLSGFGIPLDPASTARVRPGARQLLLGRRAGRFMADAALDLPDERAARERILAGQDTAALLSRWLSRG